MFTGFMVNTWIVASIVAAVGGLVGFFVVLRGSAFVAHAVPKGAFAGAAAASLLGLNPILGLGVASILGALGINWLGRRGRHDAAVALILSLMLALGALFVSWNTQYEAEIFALLFGEVLGINSGQIGPTALLAAVCAAIVVALFRPLLLASAMPDMAEAAGVRTRRLEVAFLIIVALATTLTLPVVGALLIFSLMIGPAAAARLLTANPISALLLSVALALGVVWLSIAGAYQWDLPVGFLVGTLSTLFYALTRGWVLWQHRHYTRGDTPATVASARPHQTTSPQP